MKNHFLNASFSLCMFILLVIACKKNSNSSDEQEQIVKEVRIGDSVIVTFPSGSINSSEVSLKAVRQQDLLTLFQETSGFYSLDEMLPYQMILNIGKEPPQNDSIVIAIKIPDSFKTKLKAKYGFQLFAQAVQKSSFEIIDNFYQIPSSYDPTTSTLKAYITRELFSDERTTDKSFEAIFIVGTTPGENTILSNLNRSAKMITMNNAQTPKASTECDARQIGCPLLEFEKCKQLISMDDLFGPRLDPLGQKVIKNHRGVDYKVGTGTTIYSVSDGVVETVATSVTYGKYVFIRHTDKTGSFYAHLSEQSVSVGTAVKKGQILGKSGNTGTRTTGPHLHFEYYSENEKYAMGGQIDPYPCISEANVDGDITIRDNGNIADDAFEIYLDDNFLGATEIGASNSVVASNLKPGNKNLTLKCTVAPDNVGTYEVILNSGLTFVAGGAIMSGTIARGQSITWPIVIPQKLNSSSNVHLRKINAVKER